MIAGLCRIATSLWLHFVASPQRVPVYGHRRRGRAVVIFVYKTLHGHGLLQHGPRLAVARSGECPVLLCCAFETGARGDGRVPRREARMSGTRRLIG